MKGDSKKETSVNDAGDSVVSLPGPESTVRPDTAVHPLLQEKYTGLETARLWKPFFLSFLAKTKREQPLPGQVYCEIWPHSLQFWLHNFSNFWVKIGALVRPHLSSWTGFDLPIISGVKF